MKNNYTSFFRYLHNYPKCFWTLHKSNDWERASGVPRETRLEICGRFGLTSHKVVEGDNCGCMVNLVESEAVPAKAVLAEGGGKCWFPNVYLLTGKKSGKYSKFAKHSSKYC